jgi:hypothetical protein
MKISLLFSLFLTLLSAQDFSSSVYQRQSRQSKLSQIWSSVTANPASGAYPSPLGLAKIFLESMNPTMEFQGDSFPEGRSKLIHSVGVVGKVQFVPEADSPYTGFFQGADSLVLRMSLAKEPDQTKTTAEEAYDNFTPGFALKFLRDGKPSANLVAMFGVNGVPTWNFFGKDFSNHIPGASGAALKALAQKFSTATDNIQSVGLKEFSTTDQNGNTLQTQVYPWKLIFRAPASLKNSFPDNFEKDYKEQLMSISSGTVLYDVYAVQDPSQACEKKIGVLKLTSKFTTSKFGDEKLFFQHQDMKWDLK